MSERYLRIHLAVLLTILILPATTLAGPPRRTRLPEGRLPDDSRLGPLKTLDDYFPFAPSPSITAWQARAEQVRRQLRGHRFVAAAGEEVPLTP